MRLRAESILLSAAMFLLLFSVGTSHAIPAFTRANKVECTTCHTIFPALNEYGEAFQKNGYVYFGKSKKKSAEKQKVMSPDATRSVAVSSAGDVKGDGDSGLLEKLKAGTMISGNDSAPPSESTEIMPETNKPQVVADVTEQAEGVALSGVPEQLPISFTAAMHGTYNPDSVNEFDFSTRTLKLNGGGNFREKVGFFASYVMYTENASGITNTSQIPTNLTGKSDIGELFLIYRHALNTPINMKIGRFQPKLGLWKSNNKLATTNSYAPYAYTVGSSLFKAEQSQDALEANAIIASRIFMAGGVVNRKLQNAKEYYVHTSVKLGGADYLANEPEIDLDKEERIMDYLTMTIGGYGYFGTNGEPNTVVGIEPRQNKYYRAGFDIDLLYKLARLKLSGVTGKDENPSVDFSKPSKKSAVGMAEAEYSILLNLIAALRFEYDIIGRGTNIRRIIPTLAYSPIENLKFVGEYKYESGTVYDEGAYEVDNKVGTLGVTFSF